MAKLIINKYDLPYKGKKVKNEPGLFSQLSELA